LTQNVISLLISLAEQNIFFSGDTAQTIAKGVGFRFYDLKKVFERYDYENSNYSMRQIKPKVLQLCKNFRSHSKILDLANSVVSLLELLFPKTIDKLKKETSDSDGPKPIIINQSNEKLLESLFNQYKIWGGQFKDDAPT
jgi:superfamily I DNA/RNA helicase